MGLFDRIKDAQSQAQDAMAGAPGGAGAGAAMPGDMTAMVEYQQRAQKLAAAGVETSATVNGINNTGQTDPSGSNLIEFAVTIAPPGGTPYDTTIGQYMLPAQLEGIAQGATVTVKYDPDNPSQALIYGW